MDNRELLKVILVLIAMPVWLPFVKALWEELNDSMRPDGGLFGKAPSPREREELQREIDEEEPRVVHEPLAHIHARSQAQSGSSGSRAPRGGSRPSRAPSRAPSSRRGFR